MQDEVQKELPESRPENLARYFKYYRQDIDNNLIHKIGFKNISPKTFYLTHKKIFDKIYNISQKYGINAPNYIKYCVVERRQWEPKSLIDMNNIMQYSINLTIEEQRKKIYNHFIKSANYIADECIREHLTVTEYLSRLVSENRLAYEYFCGNISKYYIASLQNFKEIFFKLNSINQDELSIIYNTSDELNSTLQDIFIQYKNKLVKPISFTESIIKTKLLNKKDN